MAFASILNGICWCESCLKNRHKTMNEYTIALKDLVEKKLGFKLLTSHDFSDCQRIVFEQTRRNISVSTLKRFWNYVSVSRNYAPGRYSLDTLSIYIGYRDYKDFRKTLVKDDKDADHQDISVLLASATAHLSQAVEDIEMIKSLLQR